MAMPTDLMPDLPRWAATGCPAGVARARGHGVRPARRARPTRATLAQSRLRRPRARWIGPSWRITRRSSPPSSAGLGLAFLLGSVAQRPRLASRRLPARGRRWWVPSPRASSPIRRWRRSLRRSASSRLMFGGRAAFLHRGSAVGASYRAPGAMVQIAVATVLGFVPRARDGLAARRGWCSGLALSVASTVVLLRARCRSARLAGDGARAHRGGLADRRGPRHGAGRW